LTRLLLISFVESFATILVERGVFFYTHSVLLFTREQNLWLALTFGRSMLWGPCSVTSSRCGWARRGSCLHAGGPTGRARGLDLLVARGVLFVGAALLGFLNGLKWPVVESYIAAGKDTAQTARAIGLFNVSWASAVPLALVAAGPLLDYWANGIFLLAGLFNVASILMIGPLAWQPERLPQGYPGRPENEQLVRWGRLLISSRWFMLGSYALMWILAALIPDVFQGLGYPVGWATALSGLMDAVRVATFATLQVYQGWHGRASPLVVVFVALPAGFFLVLFGGSVGRCWPAR